MQKSWIREILFVGISLVWLHLLYIYCKLILKFAVIDCQHCYLECRATAAELNLPNVCRETPQYGKVKLYTYCILIFQ